MDINTVKNADTLSAEIADIVMTLSMIGADHVDEYIPELQKLDAAATGYTQIIKVSRWCQNNLTLFKEKPSEQMTALIESAECWSWIELISAILADPEETSYESALKTEISRKEWLNAYEMDDLQALISELKAASCHASDNNADKALSNDEATATSLLSFTWEKDTHPEFLEAFFEETTELIGELATQLHKASQGELDSDNRYNASRLAHTVKGGSAIAGITALSEFSYQLEKILDFSVKHELKSGIYPLLDESAHCLNDLFKAIKENTGEPDSFTSVFNRLSDYAETLEEDAEPLTLGKPQLPDFITQQSATEPSKKTTEDIAEDIVSHDSSANQEVVNEAETEASMATSLYAELDEIIMTLSTINTSGETGYASYINKLPEIHSWAETSGYSEIAKAGQWCQQNFVHFEEKSLDKSNFVESGECWLWLELISAILSDPDEPSYLADLMSEFQRDEWVIPYEMDHLQSLLIELKKPQESDQDSTEVESTHTETSSEAYQFSWDDDVHPELLSSYLLETPDQISQVASLLAKISKGDADKADHQQASRIAHTIKGASGVVGITALVEFTHRLEDILDYSINHQLPDDISTLLAESSDCLEDLFDAIQSKDSAPEEFAPLLSKLTEYSETLEEDTLVNESMFDLKSVDLPDFIKQNNNDEKVIADKAASELEIEAPNTDLLDTETKETAVASVDITTKEEQDEHDHEAIEADLATSSTNKEADFSIFESNSDSTKKAAKKDEAQEHSDADSFIRVPVNIIDKLLNLVGELVTTSTQVADKIDKSINTSKQVKTQDVRVHKMLEELDTTLLKQEKEQSKVLASLQESDFDHLEMDTYNELHSISGLLTESILDSETIEANLERQLHGLKDDLHTLDILNKDLSDVILSSRMVSIDSLTPRLERIVRQTSKKTRKKVELVVTGNEINVDTDILNGLTDPLLHLLRNAIDHGIEYPADRATQNKDKAGHINLDFSRQGNHIQMQLKDDGAGIDAEKIYQKAIDKNLISSSKSMTKAEKLQLILLAGFSTQENVTEISGRGVGMDVVNSAVHALNGTLEIESEEGKGTTFTINIPLTLVTSATLLVSISGRQVAIPSESVEQLHYLSPEMVIEREQGYFILHDKVELPIQSLASLIGFPATTPDFSKSHTLLFVKNANETHAIFIDEILSSRQTVIRNLSDWLDTSQGLIGACHLPDGEVAPVINLPQVLSLNAKTDRAIKQIQLDSGKQNSKEIVPTILVVDDSLSNRKALSLIIEQTEFDVMTAVDGLDALKIMNENPIDLVFTDLEMPRMNGIELTQAIRAWDDKKETPVVMITSRTTSKHRELAEKAGVDDYLTKPVVTEILLNSILQWLNTAVA